MALPVYYQHMMRKASRGEDVRLECDDANEVYALAAALNRWRKDYVREYREDIAAAPETVLTMDLELVRVRRRFDPPRVELAYDDHIDRMMYDSEGNPCGTPRDLELEHYYKVKAEYDAEREKEEEAVSQEAKDAYKRKLERELGVSLDDNITSEQQQALDEARRQKGEDLTEEEREHIIRGTQEDEIGIDFGNDS